MRKIGTQHEIEEKRRRNTIVISSALLVILFGSIVGYGFLSNPGSEDSGSEGDIQNVGDYWIVNVGEQRFYFLSSPEEARIVPYYAQANINDYVGSPLYIASENEGIAHEIASSLGRFAERVQPACYGKCEGNLPEKDCSENLIVWKEAEISTIYQEGNCVFIEGDMVAVDAFLYRILGIIK